MKTEKREKIKTPKAQFIPIILGVTGKRGEAQQVSAKFKVKSGWRKLRRCLRQRWRATKA